MVRQYQGRQKLPGDRCLSITRTAGTARDKKRTRSLECEATRLSLHLSGDEKHRRRESTSLSEETERGLLPLALLLSLQQAFPEKRLVSHTKVQDDRDKKFSLEWPARLVWCGGGRRRSERFFLIFFCFPCSFSHTYLTSAKGIDNIISLLLGLISMDTLHEEAVVHKLAIQLLGSLLALQSEYPSSFHTRVTHKLLPTQLSLLLLLLR